MDSVDQFNLERSELNEKVLATDNKVIKRIYSLDTLTFTEGGSLDIKTKEIIGLTTSLALRCDDCVKYHLGRCKEVGLSKAEIIEAMSISNLIGGTIVIPHLRRAIAYLEVLEEKDKTKSDG